MFSPAPAKYLVESREGRGRCLFAKNAIARGEIILQEAPTALVVSSDWEEVVCGVCMQTCVGRPVFALTNTDSVRYCSTACITADHSIHVKEEESFKLLKGLQKQINYRLDPLKLIFRVASIQTTNGDLTSVDELEAVDRSLSPAAMQLVADVASKLEKIAKIKKLPLSYAKARHLLLAIRCNAHRILDSSNNAVGLGLFPLVSLINHDCKPNVTHYFVIDEGKPPLLVVRAIVDVAAGEELVYSYVPLYQSTRVRREQLHDVYGFRCQCSRCNPSPLPPSPPSQSSLSSPSSPSPPSPPPPSLLLSDDSIIDASGGGSPAAQSQLTELEKLLQAIVFSPAESETTTTATTAATAATTATTATTAASATTIAAAATAAATPGTLFSSLAQLEGFYSSRTVGFNPCHRLALQSYCSMVRLLCPASPLPLDCFSLLCDDASPLLSLDLGINLAVDDDGGRSGDGDKAKTNALVASAAAYGLIALGCIFTFVHSVEMESIELTLRLSRIFAYLSCVQSVFCDEDGEFVDNSGEGSQVLRLMMWSLQQRNCSFLATPGSKSLVQQLLATAINTLKTASASASATAVPATTAATATAVPATTAATATATTAATTATTAVDEEEEEEYVLVEREPLQLDAAGLYKVLAMDLRRKASADLRTLRG